jgi:hypothetical protein
MNRKIVLAITIVFIGVLCLIYMLNFSKTKLISELYSSNELENITDLNVTVFFDWGAKEFYVDNNENIIKIIENMKVKPILQASANLDSEFYNNYLIKINTKNDITNAIVIIRILDDSNIAINNDTYRIVDSNDLKHIFTYTILSQENTEINKYYYDLVNEIAE